MHRAIVSIIVALLGCSARTTILTSPQPDISGPDDAGVFRSPDAAIQHQPDVAIPDHIPDQPTPRDAAIDANRDAAMDAVRGADGSLQPDSNAGAQEDARRGPRIIDSGWLPEVYCGSGWRYVRYASLTGYYCEWDVDGGVENPCTETCTINFTGLGLRECTLDREWCNLW